MKLSCDCCGEEKGDCKIMYSPIGDGHLKAAILAILGVNFVKVPICKECRKCEDCSQEMETLLMGKWEEKTDDPLYIIIEEKSADVDIKGKCGCQE